nr:integrase, catalytic region, zinc finger, CCHC-type, peptidase aspartic, catalytic [Tanacetum cinerariifolium]
MIQVRLKTPVRQIRTDNRTEFVNQTLREYYEQVGISHETSVARSPQQNGIVERRNRTLIEAARTMLIYAKAPLVFWAEAVATTCYTKNRSIIRLHHGKTPYELLHNKPPDLSFLHVFGALCYPTNDSENLGQLQPKGDIDFDELTTMASEHSSSGPALHEMTHATISSGLVPNPPPSTPFVPSSRIDWDMLFQLLFDELLTPPPNPARWVVDPDNPNHMYKLKKALYGLKQAPRAWYDMFSSFLISQDFSKGFVDPTLFIRRDNTRRSTSGSMQFLGDRLVSWSSKRQKSDAISSTKAEYITLFGCCAQVLWMRSQLTDYDLGFNKIPRFHFIKEHVENGVIELYFVNTEYQLAHIFPKGLGRERIEFLIIKLGMRCFTLETLKQLADEVEE